MEDFYKSEGNPFSELIQYNLSSTLDTPDHKIYEYHPKIFTPLTTKKTMLLDRNYTIGPTLQPRPPQKRLFPSSP